MSARQISALNDGAPPPPITPAFLRPEDAARYVGISRRQLSNWNRDGLVPCSRLGKRLTLYAVADLNAAVLKFRTGSVGRN